MVHIHTRLARSHVRFLWVSFMCTRSVKKNIEPCLFPKNKIRYFCSQSWKCRWKGIFHQLWIKRKHYAEHDGPAEHFSRKCVPEVFLTMAGLLGERCTLPRGNYFEEDSDLQVDNCIFASQMFDIFWTDLVYVQRDDLN